MSLNQILRVQGLCCAYGNTQVLHDVSIKVNKGEIVSLIGSNGAGKTTLLLSLFGNPKSSHGDILFQEQNLRQLPVHKISPLGMALVPEGRRIFPKMTVEENLVLGLIARREKSRDQDLQEILTLFPILKQRRHQRAGTLSGGEQQMLAIGRGLMARPDLMLLDEPSLGLAPLIVKQIFSILKDIRSRGTTIFLVEQNAHQALKLADRAYVLVNGRITMEGTGDELLCHPEVKQAYLG